MAVYRKFQIRKNCFRYQQFNIKIVAGEMKADCKKMLKCAVYLTQITNTRIYRLSDIHQDLLDPQYLVLHPQRVTMNQVSQPYNHVRQI